METLLKSESRDHEHLVSFLFHAATLYTGCGDAGVRGGQELSAPGRVSLDDVRVPTRRTRTSCPWPCIPGWRAGQLDSGQIHRTTFQEGIFSAHSKRRIAHLNKILPPKLVGGWELIWHMDQSGCLQQCLFFNALFFKFANSFKFRVWTTIASSAVLDI